MEVQMANELQGRRVAILLAPVGTEQAEFTEPKKAVEDAGAQVDVVGLQTGEAQTMNSDVNPGETFVVEKTFYEVSPGDYDALIVPGGTVGADTLRGDEEAVAFVRGFFEQEKPVGVICHGPWTLVEADVVRGRTLTSYPSLQTDIRNAGGEWVDEEVVTDQGLVTSRNPDDLPAFCSKLVEEIAEGKHAEQARSA
jgi:protease I